MPSQKRGYWRHLTKWEITFLLRDKDLHKCLIYFNIQPNYVSSPLLSSFSRNPLALKRLFLVFVSESDRLNIMAMALEYLIKAFFFLEKIEIRREIINLIIKTDDSDPPCIVCRLMYAWIKVLNEQESDAKMCGASRILICIRDTSSGVFLVLLNID